MFRTNHSSGFPKNNDIYGEIICDEQIVSLIESIQLRGLEELLIDMRTFTETFT